MVVQKHKKTPFFKTKETLKREILSRVLFNLFEHNCLILTPKHMPKQTKLEKYTSCYIFYFYCMHNMVLSLKGGGL